MNMPVPRSAVLPGGLRTGADYVDAIRDDGRTVYYNGEVVRDVAAHPAFRGAVESVASLYDLAACPDNIDSMTYEVDGTGRRALHCYRVPRSVEELRAARGMSAAWAEATCGLMGRTPDHVAGFLSGFAAKPALFASAGAGYGENVERFFQFARDRHLYVSYAIVPPQIDRSKPAHQQSDPTLYAGVVAERDGGIVIKGAQQLATGAVLSDYIYVSCIHPLQPGDENYAFGVVIPMNAPGLKVYSRKSFAHGGDARDYPLSARFDETDALLVLDDVFVPWEHVFIYRNLDVCWNQWWKTPAHSYGNYQAQVRYATKLRFLLGLAKRITEITGVDAMPPVRQQLGELAAQATIVELMIDAQESRATVDGDGVVWPAKSALYAVMSLQGQLNSRMVDMLRELSGGSMIMLPSSLADFDHPDVARDLERYIASPGYPARDRVALLKMAWDLIGSEFAGRHQQYEKFYGGASFLVKQNMFRTYDFDAATSLVDRALAGVAAPADGAAA
ncbi:Anthranilate 3-monooxygenase oxygenase component [Pigmentiphaga humi]|uniref:Anthranilate 3-monooxygenase oxygenase component n=1 Tax=Pigmentiphaga humi TaxID=2478468 RepID=A0A3P4B5X3_9BURK|nr:4-hydroxyphenylacetate 3-hydroxylase N-terminal domain-containing protein [Pigmentiphaga humi]VCU71713.1 Anthranilate 3-monooxygenase oxygenase component [Pigmentiphaga humi]